MHLPVGCIVKDDARQFTPLARISPADGPSCLPIEPALPHRVWPQAILDGATLYHAPVDLCGDGW